MERFTTEMLRDWLESLLKNKGDSLMIKLVERELGRRMWLK